MHKYSQQCGPNATDYYDDYIKDFYSNSYICSHVIEGVGAITKFIIFGGSNRTNSYTVKGGITELCDDCFSSSYVDSVDLPSSVQKIGNRCFKKSKIKSLSLPTQLRTIGHNNFPATLCSLDLPSSLEDFPIDNIAFCNKLTSISVDFDNKHYIVKDDVLYNFNMTEVLFCVREKMGRLYIPNTVTKIGDYCFAGCKHLDMIVIPTSVSEIGDYAFQNVVINKLNIRNTVKTIGQGCFYNAIINEEFKLSHNLTFIPSEAFRNFLCKPSINVLDHIKCIGLNSFNVRGDETLPCSISLFETEEIQASAFSTASCVKNIELFSSVKYIGNNAFGNTQNSLNIRFFSYVPIRVDENAFANVRDDSVLIVPKGTKIIFENASPWMSFPFIEEWDVVSDKNTKGKFVPVSDELYFKRLQSIAYSKSLIDRDYLIDILSDLLDTYMYLESDEDYETAKALISYNRSFAPALIDDFEKRMCANWPTRYKLKIINTTLIDHFSSPLTLLQNNYIVQETEPIPLSFPEIENTSCIQVENTMSPVSAYFNDEILKHLIDILNSTKESLKIAVSWITNLSLFNQLEILAKRGVKISVITNNDLINNGGYCLNLNELIECGIHMSLVEYPHLLHHKFAIVDDKLLITGSYNWTRFSSKNYENMVVISDDVIIEHFNDEFTSLLDKAEYKDISRMPEYVKERPEYDRSAFKQYITEELDAESRETSDERNKITALRKAVQLNPSYLEILNPGVQEKYKREFEVIDNTNNIQHFILNSLIKKKSISQKNKPNLSLKEQSSVSPKKNLNSLSNEAVLAREAEKTIAKVKATGLIMCLDISGSMKDKFDDGHIHKIIQKSLSASLAITNENVVNIWTFGNDAYFIGDVGLNSLDSISRINCKGEGTELHKFIEKAKDSIKDGALCIILTDDDQASIRGAVEGMKNRNKVFWQIIVYESNVEVIKEVVCNINNISVINMSDYENKNDFEISKMLLADYITWKQRKK